MSRRSRAREVALQVLFQDDLNPTDPLPDARPFLQQRLSSANLIDLATELVVGVRCKRSELDQMLQSVADNWTVSRMAVTDRNVLRLGAFELLHTETPDRVAVDEAVELAKRFGSAQSAPFVNGILDQLFKEQNS